MNSLLKYEKTFWSDNLAQFVGMYKTLESVYSVLGVGLVFFDVGKQLVHVNESAKEWLTLPNDYLGYSFEQLKHCFYRKDYVKLEALIEQVRSSGAKEGVLADVVLRSRPSVVVIRNVEQVSQDDNYESAFVMIILDLQLNSGMAFGRIDIPLGLTKAEYRLVMGLASGLTAKEYAFTNHISIHTVYSQIKSALSKTGARRQADLVRMAMSLGMQ